VSVTNVVIVYILVVLHSVDIHGVQIKKTHTLSFFRNKLHCQSRLVLQQLLIALVKTIKLVGTTHSMTYHYITTSKDCLMNVQILFADFEWVFL